MDLKSVFDKYLLKENCDPQFYTTFTGLRDHFIPPVKSAREYPLIYLPALIIEALGGLVRITQEITAAWSLLYLALYILDKIEDKETVQLSLTITESNLINLTTSMIFCAQEILNCLEQNGVPAFNAQKIRHLINQTLLSICAAQYADINQSSSSLSECWKIYGDKSAKFFSCGCSIGAIVAHCTPELTEKLSAYGFHFGMALQIANDFKDFSSQNIQWGKQHVAVHYAKQVLPTNQRDDLLRYLSQQSPQSNLSKIISDILVKSGALIYLKLELQKQKQLAHHALSSLNLNETAFQILLKPLEKIH